MPSPKATKEPEPGEPMSERNVDGRYDVGLPPATAGAFGEGSNREGLKGTDAMLRGSQQRPDMQPGCLMGTLYGGPVRAPKRGG